jgi:two-component sensor histidine kinase
MNFPRPMPLPSNSLRAWVFAVVVFLLALAIRFAFIAVMPTGAAYAAFIPAIILVAYFSGLWPAIVTVGVATVTGWYFFLPSASLVDAGDWGTSFGPFLAICVFAIAIVDFIRRTQRALEQERSKSAALAEQREVLFRELQHRVSNNLAIVSALLNLQRTSVTDEKAKQALTEAATRLALIAKIHRRLHDPAGASLRFGPFVEDLCRDVLEAAGAGNIAYRVSASDTVIAEEKLVPLALIVTELISNALEHGFAGRPNGTIRIDLTPQGSEEVLTVGDDGNGLPPDFTAEANGGMGLRIVQSLAQQIDGRFAMENGRGTTCRLIFTASSLAPA